MSLADSIILDINGVPGSGKSLLSVAIAQAKISEWRKELMRKNEIIESNNIEYNFNHLKQLCINQWFKQCNLNMEDYEKEKKALLLTTGFEPEDNLKDIEEISFYSIQYDYYNNIENDIFKNRFELEYYYNFYLIYIRQMLISNMPIYDKLSGRCCLIANLKWFEQAHNNEILIEPYTILILDEIDKEWNSFSSERKVIVSNGIVYTIQMWRHLTKNKGVFIMAYQLESSLLYQIRANAENLIKLYKHKKDTLTTLPFVILDALNCHLLRFNLWVYNVYMNKREKIKTLSNEYNYKPKRYQLTFHKILFTKLINFNLMIMRYLSKFIVFKLFAKIINSGDDKKSKKEQFKINLFDITGTYNNTFFFPEHTRKLLNQTNKLLFNSKWGSTNPNIIELEKVNSYSYDKFFNISRPEKAKKKTS